MFLRVRTPKIIFGNRNMKIVTAPLLLILLSFPRALNITASENIPKEDRPILNRN